MDNHVISKVLDSKEMSLEVKDAFDAVMNIWGVNSEFEQFVGWGINDLNFNKPSPTELDLDKILVDEWLVENGVKDSETTFVLIKLSD